MLADGGAKILPKADFINETHSLCSGLVGLRLNAPTPSITCHPLTQTENIVCERYLPCDLVQLALAYTRSGLMLHEGPFERVGSGRSQPPTTHAPRGFNNPFRGSPPHSDNIKCYMSNDIFG